MQIDITIDRADQAGRNYLSWAPVRATLTRRDPPGGGAQSTVTVRVANRATTGGQLAFGPSRTAAPAATLDLKLSPGAPPLEFWVSGSRASVADQDAVVSVAEPGRPELAAKAVMVRIRKNANTLDPAERDRFTTAFAKVNDQVNGVFHNFRDMHKELIALRQAHGFSAFLAWHRAYLLDLERELQKIDKSVALPYWRFDEPAPNVFTERFMGRSGPAGNVVFDPGNLLSNWRSDGPPGVSRTPLFDTATDPAFVSSQTTALALGGVRPNAFFDNGGPTAATPLRGFRRMEGDPHGTAHTSFDGLISDPATAPRDPLFFLLHCNVDRLWALWQRINDRFDGTQPTTYFFRGSATSVPATRIGHNLLDTMWPWNGVTGGLRPQNAPRPAFAPVLTAPWPPAKPAVGDMIDYQGLGTATSDMNYGYDDVAYGVAP